MTRGPFPIALAATIVACLGCEGRPKSFVVEETASASTHPVTGFGALAEIDLEKGDPEEARATLFGGPTHRAHTDLVQVLRSLKAGTAGVFVRLGSATIGLARAEEVGELLGEVRKRGKPVVCHADEYNNSTLLLAARGCSDLWVSAAGEVDAVGIAAQLLYANRLLERLHVGVDFLQIGKYKGAEEPYTRDGPSPEARETLEGALGGLRAAWLSGIADGRGKPDLADTVEDGPFGAENAKQRGLVDNIGDVDEARLAAKKAAGTEVVVARFGGNDAAPGGSQGIVGVIRAITGAGHGGSPHVAVVEAIGAISMGGGSALPLGGSEGISERALGHTLAKLTTDASVRAVVVRIDSPGGSALASDLLWSKLMKLREKKPVVFSVGSLAASGGYYLACTGSKIVAEPTSILGSIGVVGGKLAVGKALEEFGVHAVTIPATSDPHKAARAAYLSPFEPWDEPTRAKVLGSMQAIYDLFLRRVAVGRGTTVDKIAPSAEGRVFGGLAAKERGLVDEIGGMGRAMDLALELAGLPDDTPFETTGAAPGILELLDPSGDVDSADDASSMPGRAARGLAWDAWAEALPEVAVLVRSIAPVASGERMLTALPFALVVH